jgi:hypothetical protein
MEDKKVVNGNLRKGKRQAHMEGMGRKTKRK